MNNKMRPAVIGGVLLGLLSAIPFVQLVNACCCAWAILGGLIAANMYIKSSPNPVTPGEGAQIGIMAGLIGAAIYIVVGIPLGFMAGQAMMSGIQGIFSGVVPPEQLGEFNRQMEEARAQQAGSFFEYLPGAIFSGIIGGLILAAFATIGGLLGVLIFEKRKGGAGAPPPPPPPNFGGPPPPQNYGGGPPPPQGGYGGPGR